MMDKSNNTDHSADRDDRYEEIGQLFQRYERGELSDQEFALEKRRILRRSATLSLRGRLGRRWQVFIALLRSHS